MNYNSENYSVQIIPLIEGTYFLGEMVTKDTNYYIAKDYINNTNIESYEDSLTTDISNSILQVTKNLRIEQIQKEDDKNLINVFEYPLDSGNTFNISRTQFSYYNSMMIFKDNFTYPFEFLGNNGTVLFFENSTDVTNFVGSALVKHQEVYNNRYLISINAINEITITITLKDAIIAVMSIEY
jgi:V8-like Glu-specific endopeptidase